MICASLYRPFFIVNLLRYLAEKILLLNTTNFRGDYRYQLGFVVSVLGDGEDSGEVMCFAVCDHARAPALTTCADTPQQGR